MARGSVEARRVPVLVTIVVLALLAGVANATIKAHHQRAIVAPVLAASVVNEHSHASSSAWYCAGPLPLKSPNETSALVISNLSAHDLHAQVSLADTSGARRVWTVGLGPHSARRVGLGHSKTAGFGAASLLVDSAAVGVTQVIDGPSSSRSAPCVTVSTNSDYVLGASTKAGSDLALALFDPGATPAVVNVTLLTDAGLSSPPAFQGLPLEAGSLVVLDVGRYEPDRPLVTALVSSTGGRIVAGGLLEAPGSGQHLIASTPAAASTWYFGPAPSGPGLRQQFVVSNPANKDLVVHLTLSGPAGTISEPLQIAPSSSVLAAPVPDATATLRWAELTSSAGSPFVVQRQVLANDAGLSGRGLLPPARGAGLATTSAGLQVGSGLASSLPVGACARGWLLVGRADPAVGEVVAVANPSNVTVKLSFEQLGSPRALGRYGLLGLSLAAHGVLQVNLGAIYAHAPALPTVLRASAPVLVGALVYARGSSGSPGFSAGSAIPLT